MNRPMLSPAYLAGIIDGEGSIFSRFRNPHVSVSNTDQALMEEIFRLGGNMRSRDPRRGLGKRRGWDWNACGETAAIILRACLPYLIVKADKARDALAQWETVTANSHEHFKRIAQEKMAARAWPPPDSGIYESREVT